MVNYIVSQLENLIPAFGRYMRRRRSKRRFKNLMRELQDKK